MWEKKIDTEDLIVYEKKLKTVLIKIEARLSGSKWNVFKQYLASKRKNLNHVEQFSATTKEELDFVLKKLMKKNLSIKQIEDIKLQTSRVHHLNLTRDFKEYCMEKWVFTVNRDKYRNLLFIKFDEITELDIILHESYKPVRKSIKQEVIDTFNLENQSTEVAINFFFYSDKCSSEVENSKKGMLVGKVEIGFDNSEE